MAPSVTIESSWKQVLQGEFQKPYFATLVDFVKQAYRKGRVYPPPKDIFNAFNLCPFSNVRVVILGQDPYHGAGQAHGLCFSVPPAVPMPPSLINIFKEVSHDLGKPIPSHGDLSDWAKQGVLLLNATLTVRAHQAGSHQNRGWETFTNAVIRIIAEQKKNIVFLLWGAYAQQKKVLIDPKIHLVLSAPHPSPLSAHRGFFGNKHFSTANQYLQKHGAKAIDW